MAASAFSARLLVNPICSRTSNDVSCGLTLGNDEPAAAREVLLGGGDATQAAVAAAVGEEDMRHAASREWRGRWVGGGGVFLFHMFSRWYLVILSVV